MINLLLETGIDTTGILILGGFLLIAIILFVVIKKRGSAAKIATAKVKLDDSAAQKSLRLNIPFLRPKERQFLEAFKKVLPNDYVVFPRVGVSDIVRPTIDTTLYNQIKERHLDFVIFLEKNMQPVVVVDLVDHSISENDIPLQDPIVSKAMQFVGLPVLEYQIKPEYDPTYLLSKFLDALDPINITELKNKNKQLD